jgi:glycogen operon protein
MVLDAGNGMRLAVVINGDRRACLFTLPVRDGYRWVSALEPSLQPNGLSRPVPGRTVMFMIEQQTEGQGKRR